LAELREDAPGVVVFNATDGIPAWDEIPNTVRHYEISDFLLDRYRPVVFAGGNLLMLRKDLELPPGWPDALDLSVRPVLDNLYFRTFPCDWRYAPNFLDVDPRPTETGAIDLKLRRSGTRIQVELPPRFRAYDWLELRGSGSLQGDVFVLTDPVVAGREISFRTLDGVGPRFLVRVGSCSQWHGYTGRRLLLLHDRPQDIVSVRLLRSAEEEDDR
jgi:hypothetical protein